MPQIGVRETRATLPALLDGIDDGDPVTITRHGKPAAALLPAAAVAVWQQHQAEQEALRQRDVDEQRVGARLPTGRTPVCPHCRSSMLHVLATGAIVRALVNTADPAAGVLAVVVDVDTSELSLVGDVACASCWEQMSDRPRSHGYPASQAATAIADEAAWRKPWETRDTYDVREDTRSSRIVTAHDIARGVLIPVTRWEWLTGILDSERDQLRAADD